MLQINGFLTVYFIETIKMNEPSHLMIVSKYEPGSLQMG
jgi:hypothetical protein